MKKLFLVSTILGFAAIALAGQADARGCVRGAIVGGIVGHFVGHGGLGARRAGSPYSPAATRRILIHKVLISLARPRGIEPLFSP
jgi:uncharacterized membrane protein YeaQ/YmgE (transglycosylase-associated protein family)